MSRFKPGESGNKEGRPKGTKNKKSVELRDFLTGSLDENRAKFRQSLKKLQGGEFVKLYLQALEYCLPRLKSIEIREVPDIEQFLMMSPEERQQLIDELKTRLENEQK